MLQLPATPKSILLKKPTSKNSLGKSYLPPKYLSSNCPTYSIVFQFTFIFIHLRDTISASFPNCRTNKCIFCFGFDIYISKSFLKWCLFIKEENIPWYTAYCPQTEKNIYVYINAKGLFKNALDKYVLPSTFHIQYYASHYPQIFIPRE